MCCGWNRNRSRVKADQVVIHLAVGEVLRGEVLLDFAGEVSRLAAASLAALISSRRLLIIVGDRRLLPNASPEGLFRTISPRRKTSCSNVKTIVKYL